VRSEANLARLSSAVESLRAALEIAESRTSARATELERGYPRLQSESAGLSSALESLRAKVSAQKGPLPPPQTRPAGFDSAIVPQIPALFADFNGKCFTLLWRGSRDGFGARDFHGRCDGHANTLTLIKDTDGNIFGGFTPVAWESPPKPKDKADASRTSFLFTLKNPRNFPARKFGLKADRKALHCSSSRGPSFGDILVSDNCNAHTDSSTSDFGSSYANDTGLDGKTFVTGSRKFKVTEIEVFEILDFGCPRPPVQAMPGFADGEARSRIADVEERGLGRDSEIAALAVRLSGWEVNLGRLSSALESLRAEVSAQKAALPPPMARIPGSRVFSIGVNDNTAAALRLGTMCGCGGGRLVEAMPSCPIKRPISDISEFGFRGSVQNLFYERR
jgi:hypothetical protein